jgi:hypothetical protein
MLLRDHPLMSRYGVPNWPPVWTWVNGPEVDGPENKFPRGEIGILRWVGLSALQPPDRCYLYIDHEQSSYLGCLLFDDPSFCSQIVKLLQDYCNHPIVEIGSLDVSSTL